MVRNFLDDDDDDNVMLEILSSTRSEIIETLDMLNDMGTALSQKDLMIKDQEEKESRRKRKLEELKESVELIEEIGWLSDSLKYIDCDTCNNEICRTNDKYVYYKCPHIECSSPSKRYFCDVCCQINNGKCWVHTDVELVEGTIKEKYDLLVKNTDCRTISNYYEVKDRLKRYKEKHNL